MSDALVGSVPSIQPDSVEAERNEAADERAKGTRSCQQQLHKALG